MSGRKVRRSSEILRSRVITPEDFIADPSAFVDVRLPRSAGKTSFSFIGAGVTQNESAPTNIVESHGFCVGGAGLGPGMLNNSHLHYTAEVFVCQTGKWKMMIGLDSAQTIDIGPGDIFSVPTWVFRSFENVSEEDGFLFTLLGGDNPGGILWSPQVLDAARKSGMVLDDQEKVVQIEHLSAGAKTLHPVSAENLLGIERYSDTEIAGRLVGKNSRAWQAQALLSSVTPGHESWVAPVIGIGLNQHRKPSQAITYPHGFSVNWLRIAGGSSLGRHRLSQSAAVLTMDATVELELGGASQAVPGGSVVSLPGGEWRDIRNLGLEPVDITISLRGDGRSAIEWSKEIVDAAEAQGFVMDAGGCVAPRSLVERHFA